jgi:3D (Asp-Asp-Asp) domain-containing protein
VATAITAAVFVLLYEATIFDSQYATRTVLQKQHELEPDGDPVDSMLFNATAYCKGTVTASGVAPRSGVAAADERLLPVGSVIQIHAIDKPYGGIYTVMDTGPMIQGRHVDIYMWSCIEALQFGNRPIHLVVLRLGWDPRSTTPSLMDTLFNWRAEPPATSPFLPGR